MLDVGVIDEPVVLFFSTGIQNQDLSFRILQGKVTAHGHIIKYSP